MRSSNPRPVHFLTELAVALVVALLGLAMWVPSADATHPDVGRLAPTFTYGTPIYDQPTAYTSPERGPRAVGVQLALSAGQQDAGRGSRGNLACSDASATAATHNCDRMARAVQVASSGVAGVDVVKATHGAVSSLGISQAAAKSGAGRLSAVLKSGERGAIGRGTPRTNIAQNKQFNDAIKDGERQLGRTLSKDERSAVHREIGGQDYGYHDIVDEVLGMFGGGK
jgi:hypothetical protein